MKTQVRASLLRSLLWTGLFTVWTLAVQCVDVQPVGPEHTDVGFAQLNLAFHRLTDVHMEFYRLTDWLSLIPVFIMLLFAWMGLMQWIRRKRLMRVDRDILLLGAYYLILFAAYLLFQEFCVNYRPVLIDGCLEASYPSSTTLLVLSVLSSAVIELRLRVRNRRLKKTLICIAMLYSVLMVLCRTVSGVHWLTDIIGGVMLNAALINAYTAGLAQLT